MASVKQRFLKPWSKEVKQKNTPRANETYSPLLHGGGGGGIWYGMVMRLGLSASLLAGRIAELPQLPPGPGHPTPP